MTLTWAIVFVLVLVICWFTTVLGWPGNWLMVLAAGAYAYLARDVGRAQLGWQTIAVMFALALLGELIEFVAASLGVARAGGSKRSARLAIIGSIVGGIVGIFVGAPIPIPIVGSLIGALLLASAGAFIGATIGEIQAGREMRGSLQIGKAAFIGRILGALGKIAAGTAMLVAAIVSLLV